MLGSIALVLSVASVLVPLAVSLAGYPTPASSPEATAAYFADHPMAGVLAGFFAFSAAVPLGIYAAATYARQLRPGVRVPDPGISFFGGVAAAVLLIASGLITWVLADASDSIPPTVTQLLVDLGFALGGIGFATWLAWVGLVLGALGEISFLALLWDGFDRLVPVNRFGGLLWLAMVGFLLPRERQDVPRRGALR